MRPWIESIDQLGFVVRDLDACVRLFADRYGIGPWTIVNFGAPGEANTIPIEDVVLSQPFDDVLTHLRATGRLERGQIATVDRQETCVFADFRDTLGTCIELHKRPEDFQPPQIELRSYPEGLELRFGE